MGKKHTSPDGYDLAERCTEILQWRRNGIYRGHALQEMALRLKSEGRPDDAGSMIRRAEADTITEALQYVTMAPVGGAPEESTWRCFHCDEVFTDKSAARLHFGRSETSEAACIIKAGAERNLLKALRDAEQQADDAIQAMHNENTDAAKAYHQQRCRHTQALIAAEEAGYERGLADGRALLPSKDAPASPLVNRLEQIRDDVIAAARNMPRRTPKAGGCSTVHDFRIDAGTVWALDQALSELDAALALTSDATA